jgi:hypothetical protein
VGGALAAAAVASVAGLVGGPWAVGAAGVLVALSPIHVLASRQAGPEALASFVLAASLWLTLRVGGTRRSGLAVGLGLLLGFLATGPPALLGLAVLQLAWLARRPEGRRSFLVATGMAILVAVAAGAGGLLRSPLAEGAELGWVPATTALGAIRCAGASFTRVAGVEYHLVVSHARSLAPLTLAIISLAVLGGRRLEAAPRRLLVGGVVLPFALGAVLALLTGTVAPLQAHRMLPALPFLAVLVAVGLAGLPPRLRWGTSATIVGIVAIFLFLALAASPREASPTPPRESRHAPCLIDTCRKGCGTEVSEELTRRSLARIGRGSPFARTLLILLDSRPRGL